MTQRPAVDLQPQLLPLFSATRAVAAGEECVCVCSLLHAYKQEYHLGTRRSSLSVHTTPQPPRRLATLSPLLHPSTHGPSRTPLKKQTTRFSARGRRLSTRMRGTANASTSPTPHSPLPLSVQLLSASHRRPTNPDSSPHRRPSLSCTSTPSAFLFCLAQTSVNCRASNPTAGARPIFVAAVSITSLSSSL